MKVSIIVPIYNAEEHLKNCIESIINQSYKNIEIILIDDGSIDNSGKICDDYCKKDHRIRVIHQKNMGVSSSRNNAINLSVGKYITFVDSDDIIDSQYIELLLNKVQKNTLSIGKISFFEKQIINDNSDNSDFELLKSDFIELSKLNLLNSPCCKLYESNIIKKNKILFDSNLSLGEDLLFNLEYLDYINKICIVDKNLYFYRRTNGDSLSSRYEAKMKEIQILLFDKYTNYFKKYLQNDYQHMIFDSYRLGIITIILQNEFKNKKIGFIKRYRNCRKVMSSIEIKSRLNDIKYAFNKLDYFLISKNMILIYKIINKLRNI